MHAQELSCVSMLDASSPQDCRVADPRGGGLAGRALVGADGRRAPHGPAVADRARAVLPGRGQGQGLRGGRVRRHRARRGVHLRLHAGLWRGDGVRALAAVPRRRRRCVCCCGLGDAGHRDCARRAAAAAAASLGVTYLLLPRPEDALPAALPWWDIPARMLATACWSAASRSAPTRSGRSSPASSRPIRRSSP